MRFGYAGVLAMVLAGWVQASDLPGVSDGAEAKTRALRYQVAAQPAREATVTAPLDEATRLLAANPPEGAISERREFWRIQNDAARKSGNPAVWRKIIERAANDLSDDKKAVRFFHVELWNWIRLTGTPAQIFKMGEEIVATDPFDYGPPLELASEYARFQHFDLAESKIRSTQAMAESRYFDEFRKASIEYAMSKARSDIFAGKGLWVDAHKNIVRAIEIVDDRLKLSNIPADMIRYVGTYRQRAVGARFSLVNILINMGDIRSAREKLKELELLAENLGQKGVRQAELLDVRARVELASGNFLAAMNAFSKAEARYIALGMDERAVPLFDLRRKKVTTLVALGRLSEAGLVMSQIEGLVDSDVFFKKSMASGIEKTFILWRSGYLSEASVGVEALSKSDLRSYGSKHYLTQRDEAMAAAIAYQLNPSVESLNRLAIRIENVLASQPMGGWQIVEKVYLRPILEMYLQGLAAVKSRDASAIETGFRIADALRESAVGDVVISAAVRSAGRQPGLSELVLRQRSLKLAINASYDNLAAVQSRGERDEAIVAGLRQSLRSQQDEQLQLEKDLARRFPEYNQLTAAEPVRLQDVARMLNRNEALVSILPADNATFVWVVTRDRAPVFFASKLSATALRDLVSKVRLTLDVGSKPLNQMPVFDQQAARQLYDELLAPARSALAGRSHLIVNAAGPLGQLPFTTLLTGPVTAQGPAWLVRDYAVTHIASVGAFSSLRQTGFRVAASKPFIGFGDPFFGAMAAVTRPGVTRNLGLPRTAPQDDLASALKNYGQIPALPETRDELVAMARALGADPQQDLYLGAAASRKAVLKANLADYQVVSFSTHGLMAGDLPGLTQPALALAATDQPGESPLLTLEDVLSLKLNADWVVLSACNTAAADGEASEALSGLGRGFFYAGARALLVTHWAVESESAKQLVTATFKGYGENKSLSRSESLRRAQLKLIESKQYAHPFYWAPYALVGDGG